MVKKRWFIVQSRFGCEFKIEYFLKNKIRDYNMGEYFGRVFVPTEDIIESRGGKRVVIKKKLFPGYVLIEMIMCEKSLDLVRYLPSVLGFVSNSKEGGPCALEDSEVLNIFSKIAETENVPRPKVVYRIGELVRIVSGPFSDFSGTVENVSYEKCRLCVAVLIFGRSTPVELSFDQVEKN